MLRRLLQTDAAATLGVLDESLAGWDALDADLRAAAGLPALDDGAGRSATQVRWARTDAHRQYLVAGHKTWTNRVEYIISMFHRADVPAC